MNKTQRKFRRYIIAYPLVVLMVAITINLMLGVSPLSIALPNKMLCTLIIISACLLTINHTWLMTVTELTRLRFHIKTTPEEWQESELQRDDISERGFQELERVHNAHRNNNENTLYYLALSGVFILVSPSIELAIAWLVCFPLARLGYTYSYLQGRDNLRGVFMTLTLLSVYGIASYLAVVIVI